MTAKLECISTPAQDQRVGLPGLVAPGLVAPGFGEADLGRLRVAVADDVGNRSFTGWGTLIPLFPAEHRESSGESTIAKIESAAEDFFNSPNQHKTQPSHDNRFITSLSYDYRRFL
ncbi:hypothetical protein [Mesorhizobium silamurunense]|uniref:hypothetical protein n=1 Tax=Mesorhizobium silamurunense TaxID=499528 RepID=UPI001FF02518|nr:hypothetical protein [Mesorhizobium silamurunense]